MGMDSHCPVILVVDDEPVNIEVLNAVLQDDYNVLFATNGLDALQIAATHRPDLILLDIMLPEMDGREVLSRLQADVNLCDIPVIFVTAMSGEGEEAAGLELGAVDYMTKPINPAVVHLRVKNQLELKQHRTRLEEIVKVRTAELIHARDEAREQEELLWTVFASSLDVFIMIDEQGKVLEFNPAAEKLFGFTRSQVIGQEVVDFIVPPEWREAHRQALVRFKKQFDTGEWTPIRRRVTFDGLRADGKLVDLEIAISSIVSQGRPIYTAFMRDITSYKQVMLSLNAALGTAEDSFRAKDLFLANMSHEIRTPMNGVLGMIDLALGVELSDKARNFLSQAKSSSHILLRVINDILDYSKMEAGRLIMESVDFYLGDVLEDAINLFRQVAIDKDLELVVSAPPQSIGVLVGDRLRIQQVLVNLVGNAVKFTRAGDICLKAVLVEQTEEMVRIEFSIKDTGIGISDEQVSLLFTPFVQADSSVTRKFGGTGLGLTICKRLVEMMGGKIWVNSTPGKGSRFSFTVVLGRNHQTVPYSPIVPEDLKGLKTLVVEDNVEAQLVAMDMLQHLGMETTCVDSGEHCLETLKLAADQGSPFDLILLDWQLPGLNGLAVAKVIMEWATRPKIIIMTAFGKEEIIQDANRQGVDACLIKPMTPSLLLDTILDVFGKTVTKIYDANLHGVERVEVIRRVGGAQVLLVEDNLINQHVAQEMLDSVGVVTTLANNGQEAIQILSNQKFELVFMDVQMPVMDGYKATRKLRSMEMFQDLPIIAMTAHALAGDRENCLAAGMNDYLPKPIDINQLFQILVKWINPQHNPVNVSALLAKAAENQQSQMSMGDWPGIQVQDALVRLGSSLDFYKTMWWDFMRDHQQVVEEIRTALFVVGDDEMGRSRAHTLKGVAGNLGARELSLAASALEQSIHAKMRHEWGGLLEKLERAMKQVKESVATLGQTVHSADELTTSMENVDREAVALHLTTMTAWLKKGNVKAGESLEPLHKLLVGTDLQVEVSKLERAMDQFAFDEAIHHLETLANVLHVSIGEQR
ncbi:MAG: response regulator [Magnetococcales bacterium]|nr:response regulator [Magnetococcales bacterium]